MTDETKVDDGGLVYALYDPVTQFVHFGITRRDWLAGLAMQGLLSNPHYSDLKPKTRAMACLEIADALIAEGRK